ncbi:heterokaryon incompatibility -domain-containing protein [Rutstroemia sp. NJR-2017a WRK4]|nr:heterokaryon incompatibility -domain-containing protein [Rutstroemia sp. NJR-2017a WRK4]
MDQNFGTRQGRTIYQHSLNSNELRLLKPVDISHHSLHFQLSTFDRATVPPYTAVSYTWGTENASEIVNLNGYEIPIRPNLWSCLYHLSRAKSQFGWEHLWVDAICINQSDDTEKGAQVRYMDRTYREASSVSVWLGLPTLPDHISLPQERTSTTLKTLEVDSFDWWDSLPDLVNRPYWSRCWVIQEFLLARNLRLYCGNSTMDFSDFQDLFCHVHGINQFSATTLNDTPYQISRGASAAEPLTMSRTMDKFPELLRPLYTLLIEHCNSECKDPRDRVFSLLGLVTSEERALLGRIFPDYTLSPDQVLVITLAHLTQSLVTSTRPEITPNSEDIFQGLGTISTTQPKLNIDKIDNYSPGPIL